MNIGIDFDGTIADTNTAKSSWIKENFDIYVPPYLCDRSSCENYIGKNNYDKISSVIYGREHTLSLKPYPGVIEALNKLYAASNLYIITARTGHNIKYAKEWLVKNDLLSLVTLHSAGGGGVSKGKYCIKYSIKTMIDDDHRHLINLSNESIYPILFKHNAPSDYSNGKLKICRSWQDIMLLLNLLP